MKLLAVVLALSCVIAYVNARFPRKQGLPRPTGPVLPQYPRWRREVDSQDTTLNASNDEDTQVPIDTSSDNSDIEDESRQKREARHRDPRIRFELEKQWGKNGFVTGFTELQRRPGGHRIEPTFGATAGIRFRREAEPQRNSINFQGTQPLSGPDRRPSWDLNFNRNILNNGRTTADIYGGVGKVPGQRAQPHFGIQAERNFGKNGFLRGSGQFQPGPGGRLSPSVGITGGFRFRREANPQGGSTEFIGKLPLDGIHRHQPSWDLNVNRHVINNGHTTADVFGGLGKVPGRPVQPHVGIQAERNFGKYGSITGSGQIQSGPGGHGVSPSGRINGIFRFRREAEDVDDVELIEDH